MIEVDYMKLFSEHERLILQKIKNWSVVSDTDRIVLDRYGCIGFVRFGFDWDNMCETAKLSDSGLSHLRM